MIKQITNHKSQITNTSGFSLIELLIVFTIIAVLSTLIFGNLYVVPRMRDSQRKSDLSQIQHALEQYKADNDLYPSASSNGPGCTGSNLSENCTNPSSGFGNSPTCDRIYLSTIPKDPNGSNYASCGNYYYEVDSTNNNIYKLAACLENGNDSGPNVQANIFGAFSPCSTNKIYLLTNNP